MGSCGSTCFSLNYLDPTPVIVPQESYKCSFGTPIVLQITFGKLTQQDPQRIFRQVLIGLPNSPVNATTNLILNQSGELIGIDGRIW